MYEVSFWSDQSVLKLIVVMVAYICEYCEYTKNHWIVLKKKKKHSEFHGRQTSIYNMSLAGDMMTPWVEQRELITNAFVLNDTSRIEHFLCAGPYVGPEQEFSLEILPTALRVNYYNHHHFTDKKTEVLETYSRSTCWWAVVKLRSEPRKSVWEQSLHTVSIS